jgi:hypothetical protein
MGVILLLWASLLQADTAPAGRDYLFPNQSNGGYTLAPSAIESAHAPRLKSSTISYKAFDGKTHQVVENRGRYVNVLISTAAVDGPTFTSDHIEEMVDRLDMLYVLYTELMQEEPAGSGLLTIAFIPQTCGMGCGLVGAKGFEILSIPRNYENIIRELNAGRLESVLLHEMAHNFDTFSAYLHYLPDHAHAWTDIFEFFAPFRYARVSSHGAAPDDLFNSPVSAVWKKYVTEESANWQRCVIDGACTDMGLSANGLWAMLYYRIEAEHGITALLDSFKFLRNYADLYPPPTTNEEKEGLRILSLAMGAGANLTCYMDALKWPIPTKIKKELERTFGDGNAFCPDQDGDGFSTINGDCDDLDASRNISALEIGQNNIDDDCDDVIDEVNLIEKDAGTTADNFTHTVQTQLPFEVKGSSANPDDRDKFSFSLPASGRIRVTLCASGGFKGWVVALQDDGSFLEDANWNSYQAGPGCVSNTFNFGDMTNAGLSVIADKFAGDYSLVATQADELLPDHSGFVQVVSNPSGGMQLQINDQNDLFSSLGTDELEIWVSGIGGQFFEPFTGEQTIELNSLTAPALQHGEIYQARIRPRANGLPLAAYSGGHLFRYDQTPASLPTIDHRFSGAWFDSSHDGEGFIIEVLEENRALVYWFTYQEDGSQRWMLGVGEVQDNRITISNLVDTHGGRFGEQFDPNDVVMSTVGSLSLSFLDCSSALVSYSVDNNGANQNTSRLTHVYGHGCDTSMPALEKDISGSWYDPLHDGEGFIIEQIKADLALVFWFTYDESGNQSWMFNTGSIDNGKIIINELLQPKGGQFGRSFDPASVTRHAWGELTLDLSCSGGTATYTTESQTHSNGSQLLQPLTRLAGSECID